MWSSKLHKSLFQLAWRCVEVLSWPQESETWATCAGSRVLANAAVARASLCLTADLARQMRTSTSELHKHCHPSDQRPVTRRSGVTTLWAPGPRLILSGWDSQSAGHLVHSSALANFPIDFIVIRICFFFTLFWKLWLVDCLIDVYLVVNRCFGGTCRLHLQYRRIRKTRDQREAGGFLLGLFFDTEHGGEIVLRHFQRKP
jgi:hypothetical protein